MLVVLKEKKHFIKSTCKKQIEKNLELKEQSREKKMNYMLNGKATIFF